MEDESTIILFMNPEGEGIKVWRIGDGEGRVVNLVPSDTRSESFARDLIKKIERGHSLKE